jgi:hypothetical protein
MCNGIMLRLSASLPPRVSYPSNNLAYWLSLYFALSGFPVTIFLNILKQIEIPMYLIR